MYQNNKTVSTVLYVLYYRLVGDVLLATGFLSYCGPYNQHFRSNLIASWMEVLVKRGIPVTHDLNIISMLVESSTVSSNCC